MRGTEVRELGRLAGEAVGGVAAFAGEMHQGIATRVFQSLGPIGFPVKLIHGGATDRVYPAVRRALAAGPKAGAALASRSTAPEALPASASPRGSLALGALNGAIGDVLARQNSPLALEMALRRHGREVVPDGPGLASAFPDATPRLAVFVHGLCETDEAWKLLPLRRSEPGERLSYGERLAADLGYTPLFVRYNTGLHISDNARALSELLERVVEEWPVPVDRVALFGHSMGGLVARGACHVGEADNRAWIEPLRHVFCLGTPHLGAPLEKAANAAGWALSRLPETRAFAKLINGRSVGIKDLRFGSCVEADWCDCDPDEFLNDRCQDVPFLESATYCFVGATLSAAEDGMVGRLMGDLLVRYPSASGKGRRRRIPFELDNGMYLGGATHFDLLNHPSVYEQLRTWLAPELAPSLR
jgi:pimeloyl-ACP methyl ester carboxylesterase